MSTKTPEEIVRQKFKQVSSRLDERGRRLWAASEAKALGRGGPSVVSRATGISRSTIHIGLRELAGDCDPVPDNRIRRRGAGRKTLTQQQPKLLTALDALVEPSSRGDPQSPLRWVCKSARNLATALRWQGFTIGRQKVIELLRHLGYRMQVNYRTREGHQHRDRNAQFEYIATEMAAFQECDQPIISVDAKKKELVGDFRNAGREWELQGRPQPVRVYDFVDKILGKAMPDGVYDLACNEAWVSVGVDHDTAEFAVETIWSWWRHMGQYRWPKASDLLITADGGGSNGRRNRLWKVLLQCLANVLGMRVSVCHLPPGTSPVEQDRTSGVKSGSRGTGEAGRWKVWKWWCT